VKQTEDNMRWSIVVADDHGPEWAPEILAGANPSPVQYPRTGSFAIEDLPHHWPRQPRYCQSSIASRTPSAIVTMLPARCYVADEPILRQALEHAPAVLPQVPEGVLTLGMLDLDDGSDENYVVPGHGADRPGLVVHGYARQPVPWIARYLRQQGAMVASGILVGYARVFAAHISQHWPGLTRRLMKVTSGATAAGTESEISAELQQGVPTMVLRSLRWHPPSFPQRVLTVRRCGWSSLNTARAVARISEFTAAKPPTTERSGRSRLFGAVGC